MDGRTHKDARTPVIGVLGLGSLGEGIVRAVLAGGSGTEVVAVDQDAGAVDRVRGSLPASGLGHGSGLSFGTEPADLKRADLVIEAGPEEPAAKEAALRAVDAVCPPATVVVTAAATLPVGELAALSGRPERMLAVRCCVPPPYGTKAELTATAETSPYALELARRVLGEAGCQVVTLADGTGRAAAELVYGYLNRAVAMVEDGYASAEDVDTAMRLGCGLPYGPFQLLDAIGLDTVRDTLRTLQDRTGDSSFAPASLLERLVAQGSVGRRTGAGFHRWDADGESVPSAPRRPAAPHGEAHEGLSESADPREYGKPRKNGALPPRPALTSVGIVGSGTMARGIAEAVARAGLPVTLVARDEARASAAFDAVDRSLARAERRGRISECERLAFLSCVRATHDHTELTDADLLIEAVAEDTHVKHAVLRGMDTVAKPGAVLATVTSSLSVTGCAHATSRPSQVVGLHFFNPAPVMRLVEVVRHDDTDPEVLAAVHALTRELDKSAVECTDSAGFVVNALLFPFLNQAITTLERTGLTAGGLDEAVTTAFGHPMGPFALLDTVGLDVSLAILRRLHESAPEPWTAPAARLEGLVADGHLGRKTGSGFTTQAAPAKAAV
ncbi:3-hydroxyacyl-CoA dehydrogenase family protein [Streptomyces sp. HNM0575]|uniref:3-hydroxyacyl-CoA dehydrogenase family protein n=1 Tax=Streptomyces sp. HNM0575 TaxID=2716338 RepID=UPI00145D60CC|nr:3-hydroxyacyl-CoA dehydrogenase family protein [Streptomyces sp. HNM0575]NLU76561.1 3-hydroxyacyl-CoA dehydrogenase family protein [Streptomyces sp. HNM0575]